MKHRALAVLAPLAVLLGAASPQFAVAQNIQFMHRGPIAYMDEVDKEILSQTLQVALEESEDGESLRWSNPDSGSEGTIEVLDTHEDYGTTCRTIRSKSTASGREGGGLYRLCRADDGSWQFAPKRRQKSD
jgi:surface antigen